MRMMRLSRCCGTPNIGVYAAASENLAIVAAVAAPDFIKSVEEALQVKTFTAIASGSYLIGSLVAVNSYGAVISGTAESSELEIIEKHIRVSMISDRLNAAGNNILVNDKAAVVNPELGKRAEKEIVDALNVEVVRGTVCGCNTVGSVCSVTNKGCVCGASASEEDLAFLKDVFGMEAKKASVNHGSKYVGAGMLCNSKGAIMGDDTTPIEMGKIEDGLNLF
ncbi:MAG: translation initiation factor IF-6 [Candidatus Methanoplasma sp.]|jgi:translation initiation factor 6|nr:translation initiation factor IF-6 [Candidatus Methanoplasma sp.]